MLNFIHYLPVLFVICLFVKSPYFSWLWLVHCLLLITTAIVGHADGLEQLLSLNFTAVSPHSYFLLALLVGLAFSATLSFQHINKLAAFAAYFIAYYAIELLNTASWTEFILHFELVAVFSALLIISRNTYTAQRAAFSFLLIQIFAASCLIAGSLMLHDNILLHFKWSYDLPSYLLLLGFLIQAAVFPFHSWLILSHEKSSSHSNLLAHITLPLLSSFGLMQLFYGYPHLIYIGIFSSLYAAVYLTVQNTLTATLSYSTLTLLGLIITSIGLGTAFSTQAALFLILTLTFLFLGYSAIIKNQHSLEGHDHLLELQDKQLKLSSFNSVLWILLTLSIVGIPFLGHGTLGITWLYKSFQGYENLSWLNYVLSFIFVSLFYGLILKPFTLFSFKDLFKKWPLPRYIEALFVLLLLSLSIYTSTYAPQDYKSIFSQFAYKQIVLLFGSLPLFFIFKKTLSAYAKHVPTDMFTKLKLPTITKDPTKIRRSFYPPKISPPRVKLFYFESIENSISYVLVVFVICIVLFLWF